jgi:hypothetical protein
MSSDHRRKRRDFKQKAARKRREASGIAFAVADSQIGEPKGRRVAVFLTTHA